MEINLSYQEKGTGMPFVLLHGNGENSEYFMHQIAYFSKEYRVIAIDTRGHGRSPRGNKPFTIKQFADDLKDFLDERNISKCILLGFSDGGNIALEFVLQYPDYVEKLIVNGANLYPKGVKAHIQYPIYFVYWISAIVAIFHKQMQKKKEVLELMVKQPNIKETALASVHIPTLIIAGDKDMIKQSHTEKIATGIKTSRLCIIKGNHFIANKKSEEFNKQVEQFLQNEMKLESANNV